MRPVKLALLFMICVLPLFAQNYDINKPKIEKRSICRSIRLSDLTIGYHRETFETLQPNWNSLTVEERVGPVKVRGKQIEYDIQRITYFDDKLMPQSELYWKTLTIGSLSQVLFITADYKPDSIYCKIVTSFDGQIQDSTTKTIPIPKDADMASLLNFRLATKNIIPGDVISIWQLDMDKLDLVKTDYYALRRQKLMVNNREYNTLAFGTAKDGTPVLWRAENGDIVETKEVESGTSSELSTFDQAKRGIKYDANKLAGIPANKKINNNALNSIKVSFIGLEIPGREQTALQYEADNTQFDQNKSLKLPISDDNYQKWLSDSEDLVSQAKEIIGNEQNAYTAACKLRKWVHDHITENKCGRFSAVEILKSKSGDCRHSAVLYTALARASGIPTRLITGLKYVDGRFYGHVWAESYVGEWVQLDPTQDNDFVDASYIKLVTLDNPNDLKPSDLADYDLKRLISLCQLGQDLGFIAGNAKAQILEAK